MPKSQESPAVPPMTRNSDTPTQANAADLLRRLPGPISERWPGGERFIEALAHGSMRVELYAPVGADPQTPHLQDELYFVQAGTGVLDIEGTPHPFGPGTCFFVAAGARHRFERFSADFVTWVVFWGPAGGEAGRGHP
jgi:mannose-6-phosphate isomerase-like protein (cupin superfamily)